MKGRVVVNLEHKQLVNKVGLLMGVVGMVLLILWEYVVVIVVVLFVLNTKLKLIVLQILLVIGLGLQLSNKKTSYKIPIYKYIGILFLSCPLFISIWVLTKNLICTILRVN